MQNLRMENNCCHWKQFVQHIENSPVGINNVNLILKYKVHFETICAESFKFIKTFINKSLCFRLPQNLLAVETVTAAIQMW